MTTASGTDDPLVVEIWSDFVCPFCYLGERRLKTGIARYGGPVEIIYRSFQLRPDLARGSDVNFITMFAQRRNLSPAQVHQMMAGVAAQAAALGLQFQLDRARTTNTHRAHELAHFAKSMGRQDEIAERIFKAYFTDGLLIGNVDTLADLAAEIGLHRAEAKRAVVEERFAPAVEADIIAARTAGISSVPHIVIDGSTVISGSQEPDAFVAALTHARTARSKLRR